MMTSELVEGSDQWDRPTYVVNLTPIVINFTQITDNLQSQIYNETQYRIGNDSLLQSQINSNSIDINNLYDITDNLNTSVIQLYSILSQININISDLYNSISLLTTNLSNLDGKINSVNNSLTSMILTVNSTIKQPTGKYLSFNSDEFWINESVLNITINNISQNKKYLNIMTVNVTNGTSYSQSSNIRYLLTRITINGIGNFKSECVESSSGTMIDKSRQEHHLTWDIEKNYAIDDKVNCTITQANDGQYNITLTYINNGLQ